MLAPRSSASIQPAARVAVQRAATPRELDSHDLLGGARELLIRHNGESYRLRVTRLGKLILTK